MKEKKKNKKKRKNTWEKTFQYIFKKSTGDKKAKPNALLRSQQGERKLATKLLLGYLDWNLTYDKLERHKNKIKLLFT